MSAHPKKILLTGITPSGVAHLGNYIGAIKPAIEMVEDDQYEAYFFVADYHSLTKLRDPELRRNYVYSIAATWLAFGLNTEKVVFYRQSDVPEIMELNWILNSVTVKSLLNRGHAYKAAVDANKNSKKIECDTGINMSLFNYPVLMTADILMFNADLIPVGSDQNQHIEIARNIASQFNHAYRKNVFNIPRAVSKKKTQIIPGLDGRKMSKSYNNTIPLFISSTRLRKLIMKINTNSQALSDPKTTENCTIFSLYENFGTEKEISELRSSYKNGIGWGVAKQMLFEKMNAFLEPHRENYNYFMRNRHLIDEYLEDGQKKARAKAKGLLFEIKKIIGV